jgi:hypothetical protein
MANASFIDQQIPALSSPLADVARLRDLLCRPEVGGYIVELCCDANSTAARRILQKFFSSAQHGDFLFVLVSGHGLKDQWGKLHFATADTVLDALSATSLESRFVLERMDESAASAQVLFLDTCYSGAFAKGTTNKAAAASITRDDFDTVCETGKAVITASTSIQMAGEATSEGSVQSYFTRCLYEGIASGAADRLGSGRISLSELFTHIKEGLRKDAPSQTPQPYYYGLNPSVEVALNPVHNPTAPSDDPLSQTIRSDRDMKVLAIKEFKESALSGDSNTSIAIDKLEHLLEDDSLHVRSLAREALKAIAEVKNQFLKENIDRPGNTKSKPLAHSPATLGGNITNTKLSVAKIEQKYPMQSSSMKTPQKPDRVQVSDTVQGDHEERSAPLARPLIGGPDGRLRVIDILTAIVLCFVIASLIFPIIIIMFL